MIVMESFKSTCTSRYLCFTSTLWTVALYLAPLTATCKVVLELAVLLISVRTLETQQEKHLLCMSHWLLMTALMNLFGFMRATLSSSSTSASVLTLLLENPHWRLFCARLLLVLLLSSLFCGLMIGDVALDENCDEDSEEMRTCDCTNNSAAQRRRTRSRAPSSEEEPNGAGLVSATIV